MTPQQEREIRERAQAAGAAASARLMAQINRKLLRQKLGCWGVVAVPIIGFVVICYFAIAEQRAWNAARPSTMSEEQWESRTGRCRIAVLDRDDCVKMPMRKIEALAVAQEAAEMERLCAEEVPGDATSQAQDAIKARLRSPSSASFLSDTTAISHQGCTWTVSGQVDAQNAFGALLRSSYQVRLRRLSKQTWVATSARLGERANRIEKAHQLAPN
jgi:hypothetical protein